MRNCLLITVALFFVSCTNISKVDVENAVKLYEEGKQEESKKTLEKLSSQGNYYADFELSYRFLMSDSDKLKYFRNAAIHGNREAIEYYLDMVLFRANSLTNTNPKDSLLVYKEYLKSKNIDASKRANEISFLNKCSSIPELDINEFCKKYNIKTEELSQENPYCIWVLAEEASREDGRFGKPDPLLILQLILHGGLVPMEFQSAVNDYYEYYINNEVHEFKIENYVTSGYGTNFCTIRNQETREKNNKARIKAVQNLFSKENQMLLQNALKEYDDYIEEKIWTEEGNYGSGYITWAYESKNKQNDEFFEYFYNLIQKLNTDFVDRSKNLLLTDLNKLKTSRDNRLIIAPVKGYYFLITYESELKIDLLWNNYKTNIVSVVRNQFGKTISDELEKWIINKRIINLAELLELFTDFPIEN